MFHWLRDRRRKRLQQAPFPLAWEVILRRNMAHYVRLDEVERARLHQLVQVFVDEKRWEGVGGLALDDEIRVTIAAQACLLLLALPHDYYRNVRTILVYPSTVVPPQRRPGSFERGGEPLEVETPILGQAFHRGPVILVWDAARHGGRHPELGHNVVFHEFAHKLDLLDGAADGAPPLRDRAEYRDWAATCTREFERLRRELAQGRDSFLIAYGATNAAEFFAVATEQFFDEPARLLREAPELYRVLRGYYRQDPVGRAGARGGAGT